MATETKAEIKIADLDAEIDRIGMGECCDVAALDESEAVPPYAIVRLGWSGQCEDSYFRAGELAEALAEIDGDTDLDTFAEALPPEIEPELIAAIREVANKEWELEQAERDLRRLRWEWHLRQPLRYADFRPVRYARGGDVDYCYGERGEVAECWQGRLKKDEQQCYAVQRSPDVERIEAEIATLLRAD